MYLTRLALTDFRSYPEVDLALGPGATTFTGANGQGKTNLVEAACYAATFASHRVATDAPLVRQGADSAIVRVGIRSAGRDTLVEIEINAGRANRVRLNRTPVARPRSVLGALRCVLFAPEDLSVVKGDPDQRRRYLDDVLVASRPRYAGVRADYERVLRQRTALLRSAKAGGSVPAGAMEVWDDQLVAIGAELTAARMRLTAEIRPLVSLSYSAVSGTDQDTTVRYRMSACRQAGSDDAELDRDTAPGVEADTATIAKLLREALEARRRAELERAVCLVGPHRDELELRIGQMPARGYASHGESWSLALALRLAAHQLLRADGDEPVLLLDDVFAELDGDRRDRLASLVGDAEQVLITAAVPADVPSRLAGARYTVREGMVVSG